MTEEYKIVEITRENKKLLDERWFTERMRPEDKRELKAVEGSCLKGVHNSIVRSIQNGKCYVVMLTRASGEIVPAVLFGVIPEKEKALIWCLASNEIGKYYIEFAKVSRRIVRGWAVEYGILYNAVGEFNANARRWLAWCGARFSAPFDIKSERFLAFEIREEWQ